jgi:hypothetical protein
MEFTFRQNHTERIATGLLEFHRIQMVNAKLMLKLAFRKKMLADLPASRRVPADLSGASTGDHPSPFQLSLLIV